MDSFSLWFSTLILAMNTPPSPSITGAKARRGSEGDMENLTYPKTHRFFPKPTGPWVHSHHETTNKLVPGVSRDDLPIAGEFSNQTTRNYEALPAVRPLDWQTDSEGKPMRKGLKNLVARKAAFVQTRGKEANEPCAFCKAQKGIWKMCDIGMAEAEEKFDGSCANCRYGRRARCDHKTTDEDSLGFIDGESERSGHSSYVTSAPSPTTQSPSVQGKYEMSLDLDVEEVKSLHELGPVLPQKHVRHASSSALEAAGNWARLLDADEENEQTILKSSKSKQKSPALSTPWRSTRLDFSVAAPSSNSYEGEVVPFALDREAFND
ncbi:hypothetical protein BJX96DRAFT_79569 [Aspergillus floccosus]